MKTYDKLQEILFIKNYREILTVAGWNEEYLTDSMLSNLRKTLIKYGINSKEEICAFLSQCAYETCKGKWLIENGTPEYCESNGYEYKYRGSGYIHLTFEIGYKAYATYKILEQFPEILQSNPDLTYVNPQSPGAESVDERYEEVIEEARKLGLDIDKYVQIVEMGAEYVAENFAWDTAGYFWDTKGCDDIMEQGGSIDDISRAVNGARCSTLSERQEDYESMLEAYEKVMGE